jgi:hypothetical protein
VFSNVFSMGSDDGDVFSRLIRNCAESRPSLEAFMIAETVTAEGGRHEEAQGDVQIRISEDAWRG